MTELQAVLTALGVCLVVGIVIGLLLGGKSRFLLLIRK